MVESVLKNHAPFKRYPKKCKRTENFFVIQHELCGDDFFLCYNSLFLWYKVSPLKNLRGTAEFKEIPGKKNAN